MAAERERDILLHRQRIVECRLLEQEADMQAQFGKLRQIETRDIFSQNANDAGIGRLEADEQLERYAFSTTTGSSICLGVTRPP